MNSPYDLWLIASIPAFALTEIMLAAQAYRYDIATTVRTRAIVWSFNYAIQGVAYALRTQWNMRLHVVAAAGKSRKTQSHPQVSLSLYESRQSFMAA